jgi:hypothetical protein
MNISKTNEMQEFYGVGTFSKSLQITLKQGDHKCDQRCELDVRRAGVPQGSEQSYQARGPECRGEVCAHKDPIQIAQEQNWPTCKGLEALPRHS